MIHKIINNYQASYSGLPKAVWMLSFVIFVNRSGSIVLFFMTLYMTRKLNLSISMAGQIVSLYGIGALIGSYLGGWLSDKISARRVQLLSLITSGIGFIIISFITSTVFIAGMMLLLGMLSESFRPANATAIAEVCPPLLRARGFALNRLAVNLGITFGPAIGGFLATVDYKLIFWVDGVTCLSAAFLLWIFYHKIVPYKTADGHLDKEQTQSPYKDKIYMSVLILLFFAGIIFVQIFNTWPLYLREYYNLIEYRIGLLLTINATIIVLFEMPIIHRLERKNHLKIISIGSLLLSIGFVLLPLGNSFIFAAFTVVIWTIGEILLFPLIIGFIANRAGEKNRGQYMGLLTFSFSLAFVVGPLVGTSIYDSFGASILWLSLGVLGVFSFIGYQILNYYYKRLKKLNPETN